MALFQTQKASAEFEGVKYENKNKSSTIGGGFGAFFDATYVEIGLGLDFATAKQGKTEVTVNGEPYDDLSTDAPDGSTSLTYFSFSLLGKYPIALGSKITLSPMVGFDWNILTSGKYEKDGGSVKFKRKDLPILEGLGEENPDDYKSMYDAFLINVGLGADFALSQKLYLRLSAMYGFKTKTKVEKDTITALKDGTDPRLPSGVKADEVTIFTGGPTVKLGIGYKF
jgi:hypothetical protein